MNTNTGMNWIGLLFTIMAGVNEMPEGNMKSALLSLCLVCSAVIAFATRGSGLDVQKGKEVLDVSKDLKDILEDDRAN